MTPHSRTSCMLRRRYSSLSSANRAISASSCRYARTMRTPVRFSCACVVSVEKCSCTDSKRVWISAASFTVMHGQHDHAAGAPGA